jgi:hypothetical protein
MMSTQRKGVYPILNPSETILTRGFYVANSGSTPLVITGAMPCSISQGVKLAETVFVSAHSYVSGELPLLLGESCAPAVDDLRIAHSQGLSTLVLEAMFGGDGSSSFSILSSWLSAVLEGSFSKRTFSCYSVQPVYDPTVKNNYPVEGAVQRNIQAWGSPNTLQLWESSVDDLWDTLRLSLPRSGKAAFDMHTGRLVGFLVTNNGPVVGLSNVIKLVPPLIQGFLESGVVLYLNTSHFLRAMGANICTVELITAPGLGQRALLRGVSVDT